MILLYMNFAMTIYAGHNMPLDCPKKNTLDLINECFIANATYHMLVFTDWQIDYNTKYDFGWSMILNLVVCYIVNLLFTFHVFFKSCQSYFRIYQKNFTSVCDLMQYLKETAHIKYGKYTKLFQGAIFAKIQPAPKQIVIIDDANDDLPEKANSEKKDKENPIEEENKMLKVKKIKVHNPTKLKTIRSSNGSVLHDDKI